MLQQLVIITRNHTQQIRTTYKKKLAITSYTANRFTNLARQNSCNLVAFRRLELAGNLAKVLSIDNALSRPHTINLYDGFVGHDDVVAVAVTSD